MVFGLYGTRTRASSPPALALSGRIIYTFERDFGVIGLFNGKPKQAKRSGAHQASGDDNAARSTMRALDGDTILRKSPRGREEIQTRAHDLSVLARRLLIMADGQHTVSDLARDLAFSPDAPELLGTLQQLVDGCYLHINDEYDQRGRSSGHGKHATA